MLTINKTNPSKNHSPREHGKVHYLILHYTEFDFEQSLYALTKGEVSAHYLIPEAENLAYQLVDESHRAFHAGVSAWHQHSALNESSIGIEIVNLGFKDHEGHREWIPFHKGQIEAVIELSREIIKRYNILPQHVLAHSDIAPNRKIDPGPLFPWKQLSDAGVGAWYDQGDVDIFLQNNKTVDIESVKKDLETYGYNFQQADFPTVLKAFQMHFRPSDCSGVADLETVAILHSLVKKYFLQ